MILFINPGTEKRNDATLANAEAVADHLCREVQIDRASLVHVPSLDTSGGFYGFRLTVLDTSFQIDIPGDDPQQVIRGEPFKSRRLYVDGSSWLYGFALRIICAMISGAQQ